MFKVLKIIELLIFLSFLFLLVTQITIPVIKGRAIFPLFRRAKIESEIADELSKHDEQELRRILEELRQPKDKP